MQQQILVTTGGYQQFPRLQPEYHNKSDLQQTRLTPAEHILKLSASTWDQYNSSIAISFPRPVSVHRINGNEALVYKSADMKLYRIYPIEWNGKRYGVRKTKKRVQLLRFYSTNEQRDKRQIRTHRRVL